LKKMSNSRFSSPEKRASHSTMPNSATAMTSVTLPTST